MSESFSRSFSGANIAVQRTGDYFTIGQMAQAYDVSLRALRFYEDKGLLAPLRHGSVRLYDVRQRMRVKMILKGKRLGFTLTEIRELLGSQVREEPAELETLLDERQVITQIDQLERQREVIEQAITELRVTHRKITGAEADCAQTAA